MGNPEYDRFGPWIIEISALDPPPPLFQPYLTRQETPLLDIGHADCRTLGSAPGDLCVTP